MQFERISCKMSPIYWIYTTVCGYEKLFNVARPKSGRNPPKWWKLIKVLIWVNNNTSAAQALALFQNQPLNLFDIQSNTQILLCSISHTSLSDYWRITLQRCVIILFLGPIKSSRLAVHKIQKPKSAGHQKQIVMLNYYGRSWACENLLTILVPLQDS